MFDNLGIVEQLIYCTVRITADLGNGDNMTGTGFFYLKDSILYLVSNKHVVEEGNLTIYLTKPRGAVLTNPEIIACEIGNINDWFCSDQYDVAVYKINTTILKGIFFKNFTPALALEESDIDSLDTMEEIIFIGYPNGLSDTYNNTPIVRRGTTATHIGHDYDGEKNFLIDASVFPGSSGSPVFIVNKGGRVDKKGNIFFGKGKNLFFLGIVTETLLKWEDVVDSKGVSYNQEIDLGVVIKQSVIDDLIDQIS